MNENQSGITFRLIFLKLKLMKYIKIILYLVPVFLNAQFIKIKILDTEDKKPLSGIQILSERGSLITDSNVSGEIEIDRDFLNKSLIKKIIIYGSQYHSVEFNIGETPSIIYLEKIKSYQLEPVVIVKKHAKKHFTIKAYIRSWQLVNNKLVRYGDAIMEYNIPYKKTNNDVNTGIKNYAINYRTSKIDSVKQKSRIISISSFDSFLDYYLPRRDLLERGWKQYKTEHRNDSILNIYENGKEIGYFINHKKNNTTEISVSENFEGNESIKMLFWKFSGSYKNFEKWKGNDDTKHLSYLFSNEKKMIESKSEGKYHAVETINEIFIDDEIIYNDKKPKKYKTIIDKDRSFYNFEYWNDELKKHPLPKNIFEQLKYLKENENK